MYVQWNLCIEDTLKWGHPCIKDTYKRSILYINSLLKWGHPCIQHIFVPRVSGIALYVCVYSYLDFNNFITSLEKELNRYLETVTFQETQASIPLEGFGAVKTELCTLADKFLNITTNGSTKCTLSDSGKVLEDKMSRFTINVTWNIT